MTVTSKQLAQRGRGIEKEKDEIEIQKTKKKMRVKKLKQEMDLQNTEFFVPFLGILIFFFDFVTVSLAVLH